MSSPLRGLDGVFAIEVAALYHPELVVEITAVAEIPRDRFKQPA
jgi:hypothetical protein